MPRKKKSTIKSNVNKNSQSINININTEKRLNKRLYTKGNSYLGGRGNRIHNIPFNNSTTVINNIPPIQFPTDLFNRQNQFDNLANNIVTDIQSIKERINKLNREEVKNIIPNLPKESQDILKQSKSYRQIETQTEPLKQTSIMSDYSEEPSKMSGEDNISNYTNDNMLYSPTNPINNRFWRENPVNDEIIEDAPLPVYHPDNVDVPNTTVNNQQTESPTNSVNQNTPTRNNRPIISDLPRITLPRDLETIEENTPQLSITNVVPVPQNLPVLRLRAPDTLEVEDDSRNRKRKVEIIPKRDGDPGAGPSENTNTATSPIITRRFVDPLIEDVDEYAINRAEYERLREKYNRNNNPQIKETLTEMYRSRKGVANRRPPKISTVIAFLDRHYDV